MELEILNVVILNTFFKSTSTYPGLLVHRSLKILNQEIKKRCSFSIIIPGFFVAACCIIFYIHFFV